jgi:peptide-methionine (R)-S-oxide reductase
MNLDRRALLGGGGTALVGAIAFLASSCGSDAEAANFPLQLSDAEWRKRLSPSQYQVLRKAATERPFSSPLDHEKRRGTFVCAGCALPLYASTTKFDSGTGWPSFFRPLPNAVVTKRDSTLGIARTEILCRRCGGHLGHVFEDGPKPTGLRYCMNGLALRFVPA